MTLRMEPMNMESAGEVCQWKYPEPYSIYDPTQNGDGFRELLNGSYFAAYDETRNLFGYYCKGESAQVPAGKAFGVYRDRCFTDFGLGMNPSFCGQGKGTDFVQAGLDFLRIRFSATFFRLTVASWNRRAIRTYEKIGFKEVNSFVRSSPSGEMEFRVMVK